MKKVKQPHRGKTANIHRKDAKNAEKTTKRIIFIKKPHPPPEWDADERGFTGFNPSCHRKRETTNLTNIF